MGAHLGLGRRRPQRPSANPILWSALERAGFTKSHETPVSVNSEAEVGGCVAWHGVVQHGTARPGWWMESGIHKCSPHTTSKLTLLLLKKEGGELNVKIQSPRVLHKGMSVPEMLGVTSRLVELCFDVVGGSVWKGAECEGGDPATRLLCDLAGLAINRGEKKKIEKKKRVGMRFVPEVKMRAEKPVEPVCSLAGY